MFRRTGDPVFREPTLKEIWALRKAIQNGNAFNIKIFSRGEEKFFLNKKIKKVDKNGVELVKPNAFTPFKGSNSDYGIISIIVSKSYNKKVLYEI